MKFRTQLLLVLAGVTLVPLGIAGVVSYHLSRSRLLAQADRNLALVASRVAGEVDGFAYRAVEGARSDGLLPQLAEYLLAGDDSRRGLESRVRHLLLNVVMDDPVNMSSCALFDREGRKVHETAPDLRHHEEGGRPWVRQVLASGLPVLAAGELDDHPFGLWVGAPVRDASGELIGTLRLHYEAAVIQQLAARMALADSTSVVVVVVDDAGRVLAHGTRSEMIGRRLDPTLSAAPPAVDAGSVAIEYAAWTPQAAASGRPDRVARARTHLAPWWVAVVETAAVHEASIDELRRTMLVLGGLVVVLGVLATAMIASRVSRPLTALVGAAARIGRGELDVSVPESSHGEIGMLERMFNRMAAQLRSMRGALEERIDELRRGEERLDQLISASPVAMCIWDDGHRHVRLNAKFTGLFGYTREDLPTIDDWWPMAYPDPIYREEVKRDWAARLAEADRLGGETPRFEAMVRCRDGSTRHIEFRARRIGAVWMTTFTDLTERVREEESRRRLEDQLRQAQKLEAVGTLAGGIAHDFNNILIGILGNTQLALTEIPAGHPARPMLEDSLAASRRARDLVARILSFARRAEVVRRPTQLGPVVTEAARLLRALLPANIAIEERTGEGVPSVVCDPVHIHQIVMNLGANAGHAMPHGGTLTLTLERVALTAAVLAERPQLEPRHTVRLTIRDTGTGMDDATLRRLFEPFFTTKPPGEGTGLGLAVVHGILKDLGGAAVVESAVGAGTAFSLYFPGVACDSAAGPGSDRSPPGGRGETILVVDDEEVVLKVLERVLARLNYACRPFSRADDALAALRAGRVEAAAVISDVSMPGRSGLEFAREVKTLRPGLPVILATGNSVKLDRNNLQASGVVELVEKPFSIEEVAGALDRALRR